MSGEKYIAPPKIEKVCNFLYFIFNRDLQRLTMDAIASTVFSYKSDVFNYNDDAFLKNLQLAVQNFDMGTADLRAKTEYLIASKY